MFSSVEFKCTLNFSKYSPQYHAQNSIFYVQFENLVTPTKTIQSGTSLMQTLVY